MCEELCIVLTPSVLAVVLAVPLNLVAGVVSARWAFRCDYDKNSKCNGPSYFLALTAFVFWPVCLILWAASVGNKSDGK